MTYIVLDMEWNQPYNQRQMVKEPVSLSGEIIQIGAVKLDETCGILDTFKIMVAPKYYKKVHRRVAKLTGITQEQLRHGLPFPEALLHFQNWCGPDCMFLTWGPDDLRVLRINLELYRLNTAWIPRTYDAQMIFADQVVKENKQVSLSNAMALLGEQEYAAHDALNDAKATACVCRHLDMDRGIAEYERIQRALHPALKSEPVKRYPTHEAAFRDPEFTQFCCPICGGKIPQLQVVCQNADKYVGLGTCEHGDELFVRFRFTKRSDGMFRATRKIYEADDEKRAYFLRKKQKEEALQRPQLAWSPAAK